ncbi:uncharacterized protein LOC120265617 isoform X2 [Dioscorea cayenensis subsp. rotundata]|uniref:Uncharacterized protein LOC120265617 isoform X2 n=1 Tax=Dioscorea cayennensis subsp. rotundata TaxID=55577 RepID=A0AB40BPV8_DIOCR|nr:uncharacterized protein LOC120265617 isoform X2 [Dioscorea cayenensis subsp. rotundata]
MGDVYIVKYYHGGTLLREGEVEYVNGSVVEFLVDLDKLANNSCSCGKWDKSGIPCQHAMPAIAFHGLDPLNYISEWFKKETYLKAYQFNISAVKGRRFWPTSEEGPMLPPITKRMPGRPAKKRKREPLEGKNKSNTKLSKEGRVFKCGICHMEGHNRKNCQNKASRDTTNEVGSSGQKTNERMKTNGKEKTYATSKKKRGRPAYGPTRILRGAHTGEAILGREVANSSSFITTNELIARRNARVVANKNQAEVVGHQSSAQVEGLDLPTQQSTNN